MPLSIIEAEYRATSIVAQECEWLMQLMVDMRQPRDYSVVLILRQRECDSSSREPGVSYKGKAHRGATPLHLREGVERWYRSSPDQHGRIDSGHFHQGVTAFEAL